MRPWDYLFIDQPAGCITMGNSVSMDVSLYVRGNLCLDEQLADRQLGRQRPRQRLRLQQRADRQPRGSDLGVLGDRAVLVQRRDDLVRPAGADLRRERRHEPTDDPEADGRSPVLVRERPARAAVAVLVGILPRRLRQRHDAQREPGRDRPHTRHPPTTAGRSTARAISSRRSRGSRAHPAPSPSRASSTSTRT